MMGVLIMKFVTLVEDTTKCELGQSMDSVFMRKQRSTNCYLMWEQQIYLLRMPKYWG